MFTPMAMVPRRHVLIEQPFVGRANEMGLLEAARERAIAGQGQVLVLVGEPGIGKTRLMRELEQACRGRDDIRVRTARCWEGEGAPAYWPWSQIVLAEVNDRGAPAVAADLGPSAEDVARLVPLLGTDHHRTNLFEEAGPFAVQVEHVRFRLFNGIVRLLESAASATTLMILLDDLHWADVGSVRLLQFAAAQIAAMRVLLVTTVREPQRSADDVGASALRELFAQSGIARVELGGLSPEAIAQYVEQVTGDRPDDTFVRQLHTRTQGNPFFLREVVHALIPEEHAGQVWRLPATIPVSVRQAVGQRLEALAVDQRAVLSVAAVLGAGFDIEVLRRCLEAVTNDHVARTMALPNLDLVDTILASAIERGLLAQVSSERCEFTHGLIQEVLYDELGAAGRSTWHCIAGDVLEQWYGAQADDHAAEIAVHLACCPRNPAALGRALQYNRTAGDRALAQFAYEAAVAHYGRALTLLSQLGPGKERVRCELLLALGEARMRAGATAAARTASFEAAAIARQMPDYPELLACAALGFGWLFDFGVVDWERVALLEEALDRTAEQDDSWRAKVMGRLALALRWVPDAHDRVRGLSEQAVTLARRLGDPSTLAFALNAELYAALWTPRATQQRLETARELLALAERLGDRELALQSRAWCAAALLELGDRIGAEREMALFAVDAEALRQPLYQWIRAYWGPMRALLDGEFELAQRLASEAAQVGFQVEPANAQAILSAFMYMLRWYQGGLGEYAALLTDLSQIEDRFRPGFVCGVAFILSEAGDIERAREHFDGIAAAGFCSWPYDEGLLSALCALAETCHTLRDAERAVQLYEILHPFAHLNVIMGWGICCTGSVSRLLGLLATTMHRFEDAERHFADAQTMHQRMRDRPMITRTQFDQAAMLHARDAPGDRDRAISLLDGVITNARTIRMQSVLAKAEALRQTIESNQPAVDDAGWTVGSAEFGANIFRREGDMWTVSFAGRSCQLRDARGLEYLAVLLQHPGREIHAIEFFRLGEQDANAPTPPRASDTASIRGNAGDAGLVLDAEATAQYQQRLLQLRELLMEAETVNDIGRVAPLREELAFLTAELAGAGRGKRAASHAERARVTVTKGVRAALRRIDAALPALGKHLRATVHTGYFCSYTPDPLSRVEWDA